MTDYENEFEGGNRGPQWPVKEPQPQQLATVQQTGNPLDLPIEAFERGLQRRGTNRQALLQWVRSSLVEGVDFGRIPTRRGPSKPSLWKPGAEKICGMLSVTAQFPSLRDYEEACLAGIDIQNVIIRCELLDPSGHVVSEGVGARSLKQDYGDLNKVLKMASKSAYIDATLRMGGLSEVFTLDLEDMPAETLDRGPSRPTEAPKAAPKGRGRGKGSSAVTQPQIKRMFAIAHSKGFDNDWLQRFLKEEFHVEHTKDLTRAAYDEICDIRIPHEAEKRDAAMGPTQEEVDQMANAEHGGPEPEPPDPNSDWGKEYDTASKD